ncbi:hypothetical protein [Lentibacillus sp. CBA3610]|uniref:hypothetical protein n=1 Tax=Lentibacillus sp. CBA3610 TaxID=2518176 RepID=UPI00159541F6|nr:hypothetical protein [Lentibacillus sp. CBA3610]QKY68501.1 hypothetical protein Len3610_01685 [Lentibacillus sp. CBA3610]
MMTSRYIRFIYFSFQPDQIKPSLFKEAVNEFFAKQVPVLWENDHEGVIVEENPDDPISYEAIIDVFMSDLSVNLHFFVGPFLTSLSEAGKGYQTLIKGAEIAGKYSDKAVVNYLEALPYILIDQAENDFRADFVQTVLADTADDDELLKQLKRFITCNKCIRHRQRAISPPEQACNTALNKFKEKQVSKYANSTRQ